MILGMTTFTFVHVVLSLIGIFSGFVVVFGLLAGKRLDGWTALFLVSTVATSVTVLRSQASRSLAGVSMSPRATTAQPVRPCACGCRS